jgi:hypothetical protein
MHDLEKGDVSIGDENVAEYGAFILRKIFVMDVHQDDGSCGIAEVVDTGYESIYIENVSEICGEYPSDEMDVSEEYNWYILDKIYFEDVDDLRSFFDDVIEHADDVDLYSYADIDPDKPSVADLVHLMELYVRDEHANQRWKAYKPEEIDEALVGRKELDW